jgi:processing peptidase subunit alpha
LGHKLYAEEKDLANLTPESIQNFIETRCTPEKQIIVGVNVDFDELCKWSARCYAEHAGPAPSPNLSSPLPPAVYTGGDLRIEKPNPLCHLMFGWEVAEGWNGPNLAAVTVLQMFLGGGGSFSTGGPGKGMHTRLYTEVLNRHAWVESCQASSVMYADSGVFTIYATVVPQYAEDFVTVIMNIFRGLKNISDVEMQRAKNALKSSIHMNLEMRSVMMEDIGRQLVLASKVGTAREFGAMIDAVTPNDLLEVLRRCLKTKPTVVAYGAVEKVPSYEKITQRFAARAP